MRKWFDLLYNVVIGRPTLEALKAITSITTKKSNSQPQIVCEMKSNQYKLRIAYLDAIRGYDDPRRLEMGMVS